MADKTTTPFDQLVKHKDVFVALLGEDGNAYAVMGRAGQAMRRAGKTEDEVKAYMDAATEGDYDHLLGVTMYVFDH